MKYKFVTLLLAIVLLSMSVSAFDLWNPSTWDDRVQFHEGGRGGNLGYYEINDTTFWLFNNQPVKRIYLLENDYSMFKAWNIKEIEVFRPSKLFDKTNYLDIARQHNRADKIKSEQQLYRTLINKTDIIQHTDCQTYTNITNETNSSTSEVCTEWNNYTTENTYEAWTEWETYNFQSVQAGTYQTKTIVERHSLKSGALEWVDDNEGHSLVEWATWWDNDWNFKRLINLTADVGNFSYIINISYDSDMNASFKDLRFLDYATESTVLNYTIEKKIDSDHAEVRVFTQGEPAFYMYYGNPTISSASSSYDTHLRPVSYYYLDETSGTVIDAMGLNNGSNSGATPNVAGQINTSYDFTADSQFVAIGDLSDFGIESSDYSLSMWVNFDAFEASRFLLSSRVEVGGDKSMNLQSDASGDVQFSHDLSTTGYFGSLSTGTWYHLVGVFKRGVSVELYIDGTSAGSDTASSNTLNDNPVYINNRDYKQSAMNGQVDEVMIFNYSLTPEQVMQLATYTEPTYVIGDEIINNVAPNVTLISPANDTTVESNGYSADFVAQVFDTDPDTIISNCTLNIWNVSTGLIVHTQTNTSIVNNTNTTFMQVLVASNYTWNVNCVDNLSASASAIANWTINIIPIPDNAPLVDLDFPTNNTVFNSAPVNIDFLCNASDDNLLENVSLYLDNVLNQTNSSGLNDTRYTFPVLNFTDGNYDWSCGAVDNASQETRPEALLFTVHVDTPQVEITAPANASIVTETNESIYLNWTITDFDLDECWYNIGGANITVNCTDNTTTFNYPISNPDNVTITLYANDSVGRPGSDSVIIFKDLVGPTVNITAPAEGFIVTEFNETIDLNWTVNDTNLGSCWYQFTDNEQAPLETCYQESANVSDQSGTDGSCGQTYDGTPSAIDPTPVHWGNALSNLFDGNWSSAAAYQLALASTFYVVNYTKPSSPVSGANINVSFNTSVNVTVQIPDSCFNFYDNSVWFRYRMASSGAIPVLVQCYNGTWNTLLTGPSNALYEEGITWEFERTFVNCQDNTTTINYPITNPDNVTVFLFANDTIGNINSDNVTILKTNVAPQINITSPVTHYALLTGGQSLDLNFSITNSTTLDECWYDYNSANTTVDCETENATNFTYVGSVNTITVYSNNTLGNVNSTTRSWTVDSTENSVTFNATTFETKTESFILNISINESTVLSVSSILNYNNTRYTATSTCEGQFCIIETAIDVPLIVSGNEESHTWFYEVTLFSAISTATSNSTSKVQNVSKIFLELCNATYTVETLNFTAFDEQTLLAVDPFVFNADFEFWLGTGSVLKNISFAEASVSSVQLCISPGAEDFVVNGNAEYDEVTGSNYTIRNYYFQNDVINNQSQDIGLGLLLSDQSTSFILKVQDADILPLAEALIFTQRFYPGTGTFKTVQVGKTDDNGKTVGFFEAETGDYRFIIKKDGITLLITPGSETDERSQKVVGEESPFTLTFTVGEDDGASWEDFEPVDDLTSSLIYNVTSQIVSFSYIDSSDDFTAAFLEVYTINSTGPDSLLCNNTLTQSSGIVSCNMTGNSTGSYIAKGIIYRDSTRILAEQLQFQITDFAQIAGRIGLFLGWFIILIAALAFKFNEIAGIILTNAAMIFVNLIGLVNFGITWITAWIALSIIILVVLER